MNKRLFIVMHHDLVSYPPMQSLMRVLSEKDYDLYYIGLCSDYQTQKSFELMGFKFIYFDGRRPIGRFKIIKKQIEAKKRFLRILKTYNISKNDLLWIEYSHLQHSCYKKLQKLRYLVHFYEFVNDNLGWKHKLLHPKFNMSSYLRNACAVVHCEYNRAIITKGLYGLEKMPYILPNKPFFDEAMLDSVPSDISDRLDALKIKVRGKKIILYQGVFDSKERRLEEFCQAINLLPEDYMLVIMGAGGDYYNDLKKRYESPKVLFEGFVRPPYHLLITKMSCIGVLTYNPLNISMAGVLNPLYCAPNKIFEFSRYGIPMISNDVPGLKNIFECNNCGQTVTYPVTPERVSKTIRSIMDNWKEMSVGASKYYESVNFPKIVNDILNDIYYL